MKILIIGLPPKISSGVKSHILTLEHGLKKAGNEVLVLNSLPTGVFRFFLSIVNKILLKIDKNYAFMWILKCREIYFNNILRKIDKKEEIVINIQSIDWYNSVKKYTENKNIKIVLTVHGAYSEQLKAKGYSKKTVSFINNLEKSAYSHIKNIATVSPFLKKYVSDISNRNDIEMIPNGVILRNDIDNFETNKFKSLKLVFVGSLLEYKGVHIAIKSIASLIEQGYDIKFDIIGDGPEMNTLTSMSEYLKHKESIRFFGTVSNKAVIDNLIKYDGMLLPSIPYGEKGEEAFPYSCLEAMSCGVPVIASNIGGLPLIISDKIDGFLISNNSPQEISDVIKENYDKLKNGAFRSKAIKKIKNNFSDDAMVKKYLKIYCK